MKNNSKYGKHVLSGSLIIFRLVLSVLFLSVFVLSCTRDEHRHIPSNTPIELDGLTQSVDKVVFSDVKVIMPSSRSVSISTMANGMIKYDPFLQKNISILFGGRIERLYVSHNFETVRNGQRIMDIYSPDILTEQENLIQIISSESTGTSLQVNSEKKLELLGLTNSQIQSIVKSKKVINPLPIYSDFSGIVMDIGSKSQMDNSQKSKSAMGSGMNAQVANKNYQANNIQASSNSALTLKEGMYIQKGQSLLAVYNTDKVWAVLNLFSSEVNNVKIGDKVILFSEMDSSKTIIASINYIEPIIAQNVSSVEVRVYLDNEISQWKIGSLVSAKINSPAIKGVWLPKSSVVDLGKDHIVFEKMGNKFVTKTVKIGIVSDSLVQIIYGINEKDSIALNAQYMVDSESFINKSSDE